MSISNGICGVANYLKYLKFTIIGEVRRVADALKRESSVPRVKNKTLLTREPRDLYLSFIRPYRVAKASLIKKKNVINNNFTRKLIKN